MSNGPKCLAVAVCMPLASLTAYGTEPKPLSPMVVTASRWQEPLSQIASTVQIIPDEVIRRSHASSVTDLLAEHAVGFMSHWTPGQTSINLRGAATDGQGRDYRGQVLVLIDGRRSGTANLSKLSLDDTARIEIVRGPASVAYGSQAMGGVINILTRKGTNTEGSRITGSTGSWNLLTTHAYTSGTHGSGDYYLGAGFSRQHDYESGEGSPVKMFNTAWHRWGGLATWGWRLGDGRLDVTVRKDGTHDTGFRGSSWDYDNVESRTNHSLDVSYSSKIGRAGLNVHAYTVRDIDDLRWGSEVGGVDLDHNNRRLSLLGLRTSLHLPLAVSSDLLAGVDLERSELRSTRYRRTLAGVLGTLAPMDNNQNEETAGLYGELVHRLLEDRLTLRGGVRYTYGQSTHLPTHGLVASTRKEAHYDQFTYSLGGVYRLGTGLHIRASYATGFRAPTATELAADFLLVLGGQVRGNPDLKSESSEQAEIGFAYYGQGASADVALFQTRIKDRIVTRVIGPAPGGGNLSRFFNSSGDLVLRGVDLQVNYELLPGHTGWFWQLYGNATYHFHMKDEGAPATANTDKPQRIYYSQAGIGVRFGQHRIWDLNLVGIYRGPMYYDTEENLLIPQGEPFATFIHRKGGFWVWNLRAGYELRRGWRLFGGVNNVLNKNEHPIFIALNQLPFISNPAASNGGRGNSMPGRHFFFGLSAGL